MPERRGIEAGGGAAGASHEGSPADRPPRPGGPWRRAV